MSFLRYLFKKLFDLNWVFRWFKSVLIIFCNTGWNGVQKVLSDKRQSIGIYQEWISRFDALSDGQRKQIRTQANNFIHFPLISVVMPVFDPPPRFLDEAIQSVRNQIYPHWELCIADDASTNPEIRNVLERHREQDQRIKVVYRSVNGHISHASNSALEMASGDFIALLDHDDLLPEHALFYVVDAINQHPDAGLFYSDEDKVDVAGRRFSPNFKCDWNPFLFLCQNMVSHLGVYRTSLVRDLGGFRVGYEGSQDYDLAARCVSRLTADQIVHIPRVLYHWRNIPGSTAMDVDAKSYVASASVKLLTEHLARNGWPGEISRVEGGNYRPRFFLPDPPPLVTIIVSTRGHAQSVDRCVDSILERTTYPNFEILLLDCGAGDPRNFARLADRSRVRILPCGDACLPASINAAASAARGDVLLLLSGAAEVISPEWLHEMVSLAALPDVGAVGAKLAYPDNTIAHAGLVLGIGGVAGPAFKGFPMDYPGYFGRANLIQAYSAVSGSCLMLRKDLFCEVGGLNESDLKTAFSDIDLCLRLREMGLWNVWTPYARLYHHVPKSSATISANEAQNGITDEAAYIRNRWAGWIESDPAYNPNLTLESEDFSYAWPPRVAIH